ncbi:MAG: hypothetical protein ABFE08_02625 [Armatimonadia bacterium]
MPTDTFHDLGTMIQYLDTQCATLTDLVREIEEVQREFETRFVGTQQKFENARAAAVAWVSDHKWQQPSWLIDEINERLPALREAKTKRLAEVREELTGLGNQRQAIESQDEAGVAALKESNPRLNAREEELKVVVEKTRAALGEKMKEWKQAGSGLGWLTRAGKVRQLRGEIEKLSAELSSVSGRLTEVRNSWVALEKKTDESDQQLQEAWRLRTAEIARLKRELAQLEGDLETVCREAALDEILNSLAAPPVAREASPRQDDDPAFDTLLTRLIALHDETRDYEGGIAQVSELMGILKGLCEGLTRMRESVASVKSEQDMHAELADLNLQAPEGVLQFHRLWAELRPVVLDEKQAAEHPRDFAQAIKQVIGDRLSNTAIDLMFNNLGNELNRATKEQW